MEWRKARIRRKKSTLVGVSGRFGVEKSRNKEEEINSSRSER